MAVHVSSGNAKPKCPACRAPGMEVLREQEGCDVVQVFGRPHEHAGMRHQFAITCTACSNTSHDCEVCGGSGEERVYACPGTLRSAGANEVLKLYAAHEAGLLPDPGSLYEQAAPLVDLIGVVASEHARIVNESRRMAAAKAKGKGSKGPAKKQPNRV